jgi:hypothetical protein
MKEVKEKRNFHFHTVTKPSDKASFVACGYASRSPQFSILFLEAQDLAAGMESFHTHRTRFIKLNP